MDEPGRSEAEVKIYWLTPRFAFGDFPLDEDVPALLRIDCLITLSKKRPSEVVRALFEQYRYIHIPDGKVVPEEEARYAANLVHKWLSQGKNVLVHCYGGRNRSGLVAALALMQHEGISGIEALKVIDGVSKRSNGAPRALTNQLYRTFVEER